MSNLANVPRRGHGRLLQRVLPALFLLAAALLPAQAMAQAPQYCPVATVTGTVASGGSISFDVTGCDGPIGFGVGDPGTGITPHGSYVVGPQTGPSGTQFVTYSHNGDAATSDSFKLEDEDGLLFDVNVTITQTGSAIVISPASLPPLTAGVAFSQTLSSSGGTAPYTYTYSGAPFPGVSLSSAGVLSGAPTQRGPYTFTVRSEDSTGASTTRSYSGNVATPNLALAPSAATAIQNTPFSLALGVTNGTPPHTFTLAPGSNPFPTGISMNAAGVISGTTNAAPGAYTVTIRVFDGSTGPGTHFEEESFTLTVSPPPAVSIAVSPASVAENGATNLVFTLTRTLNLTSATVVNLTTGGSATAGTDYTGNVATATIPAGATTTTVTIDPTGDATVEADETVILTVVAGTGYTVGAPATATGTILNDDVPTATIAVSPTSVAEDGATNLLYTVTLSQASFSAVNVGYGLTGSATSGTDYSVAAAPLVIPAGATTGVLTVDPSTDATIEADETVTVTLNAGTGYTVGVPNSATGTILNDDLPTLSINDVIVNEGNAGTTSATFTVSLNAPAGPGGVTFDIATANGTAVAGVDYVASSLTAQTIPAGSSTSTFTVLVNGDALNEPTETFFVNVTNVTGAIVGDGQGVGTITNDDPAPSLAIGNATVVEGNAGTVTATFTVTLNAASGQTVTVNYATADATATAGSDYVATSGTLTFLPGVTTQTVNVTVNGDIVPEATETFSVTLAAPTNATIGTGTGTGTITNDDVPVTVNPATLPDAAVAAPYSQTLTASGGAAPYTFAVTAGALPAGLTLANGTISGTPTAGGTFTFTITATDASPSPGPFTGDRSYTLTVNAPTVTLPATALANATLASAYTATLNPASGGTAPYTYAITAGALPDGLILASNGSISGTPTEIGTFNFAVAATDSSGGAGPYSSAPRGYVLTVIDAVPVTGDVALTVAFNAPATNVPLDITVGTPASVAVVTPPANGTAVASGTTITYQPDPGFAGVDTFTYTATNTTGTSTPPSTVTVTVSDATIVVNASAPLITQVGVAYTQTFTWSGGTPPYTAFDVAGLPAGLSVTGTTADSVTVSGTPTEAGTFTLTATATDSSSGTGPFTTSEQFELTVGAATLSLSPAAGTLPLPYGEAVDIDFVASGGTAPYTYALAAGTLPVGVSLGNTGELTGTPTVPGTYNVTVRAIDSSTGTGAPFSIEQAYVLQVDAPTIDIAPATLPDGTAGTAYTATLTATGGVAPYVFSLDAGTLPIGIGLAADGTLSGTPTATGTFTFTVQATDDNGQSGTRAYTLVIDADTLAIAPATLPDGVAGSPYSAVLSASGGIAPYTFAISAGALPPGLTLVGDTIAGTPTDDGTFTFTVQVTDSTGGTPATATRAYTLVVQVPDIVLAPASLPNGIGGVAYSQTLTASGGAAPYAYAVTAGTLPTGLALSPSGVLSGTPTADGDFTFTVTATDDNGYTGSQAYTITVGEPTITIGPATLPAGVAGEAYTATLTASGGTGPYTFALTTGTLPPGLALASDGTLSGTPTADGSFPVTVTATDANGFTGTQAYTLVIGSPTITIAPATLPDATANGAYSQALAASGGTAPYTYAVTAGTLPAGLTLSPAGVLSGTPTSAGTATFTVTATDANDQTGEQAYTLTVLGPVALPATDLPDATAGEAYTATLNPATGGTAPYTYAVSAGALPAGVTLSTAGVLSGTPNATGDFAFTVTATDSNGNTATRAYTLAVLGQEQVITFPEQTVTEREFEEGATFELSPLATGGDSGNPVTYTAGPASVCTISGTTVTMVGPGTCTITALQEGGGLFEDAEPVTQTVVLLGGDVFVPQPAVIPTLSQGVLWLLALLMLGIGFVVRRPD